MSFVKQLRIQLEAEKNQDNALQMQAYMKDLFPFLGVKAPERKAILKKNQEEMRKILEERKNQSLAPPATKKKVVKPKKRNS